jgi:hypothetical protein
MVLRQLRRRLGDVPAGTQARIDGLTVEALEGLAEDVLEFKTLADLDRWLDRP